MDDNPWGAPSAPSSPHLDPTSRSLQLEQEPRLELEIDDNDDLAPTWGNDSPGDAAAARLPAVAPVTEDEGQGSPAAVGEHEEEPAGTSSDEPAEGASDVPAPAEPTSPSPPPHPPAHAASPEPSSPPPAPHSPPAPPTSLPTLSFDDSLLDEGPPMDDFSDVDDPVLASTADDDFGAPAGGADDFDDFGSVGEAGDDDFGDFGDFGDAAPLDEAAFDAPAPAAPPPAPAFAPAPAPVSVYPPLRLDLSNTSRRAVAPQLRDFFAEAWPASLQAVNDDPERQVEGPAQVLVTESSCVTSPSFNLEEQRAREPVADALVEPSPRPQPQAPHDALDGATAQAARLAPVPHPSRAPHLDGHPGQPRRGASRSPNRARARPALLRLVEFRELTLRPHPHARSRPSPRSRPCRSRRRYTSHLARRRPLPSPARPSPSGPARPSRPPTAPCAPRPRAPAPRSTRPSPRSTARARPSSSRSRRTT